MGLTPDYKLLANGADITTIIRERFVSLSFTDEAGMESDTLDIVLADNDPLAPVQMPPTGAEIELFLGYDGQPQRMGLFVVDEVELSGPPDAMTIRCHAAPFDASKGGKTNLQTQKTRSWPKGTKLGDLVKKIATEHGMEAAVSSSMASIALPHLDQSDESDMHFLLRVAKKYDGIVKPAGGKLVLAKRGDTKSASGQQLPAVELTPADCASWSMRLAKREASGMAVAYYRKTKKAKHVEVKVGAGEPVTRLRMTYPTPDMARAAATAELDRRKRGETTVSINLEGRPDITAEAPLKLSGFREAYNGDWVITSVDHTLDDDGYRCSLSAEAPNNGDTPNVQEIEQ